MIYFSSDFHYSHKNIVKGTSSWPDKTGTRDFKTVEEHDNTIIKNINNTVKEDDDLYFIGDWSFGGIKNILICRERINCKNIYFIYGNHDEHIQKNKLLITGKTIGPNNIDQYIPAHAIFSSVGHYNEININGQRIIMCHYAMRVWHKNHKGSWMLYGHSHDNIEGEAYGKSMDVGVDSAKRLLGEYRPFSITEIKEIMKIRKIHTIDHHEFKENI